MLSSDKDGEVIAATRAMMRTLQAEGLDIHALADGITGSHNGSSRNHKYTEEDMRAAYRSGRADGRKEALNGKPHSTDEPSWHQIALECRKHVEHLRDREQEFVEDMVCRTVHGGELTEKQAKWLRDIWTRVRRM